MTKKPKKKKNPTKIIIKEQDKALEEWNAKAAERELKAKLDKEKKVCFCFLLFWCWRKKKILKKKKQSSHSTNSYYHYEFN